MKGGGDGQRGFFEIGTFHGKVEQNLGTLLRSAYQLGAAGAFTVGGKYYHQGSDTPKSYLHIPVRHYDTFEEMLAARPMDTKIIAIEMGGTLLRRFSHPERAIYLLGNEGTGIPLDILKQCDTTVSLEAVRMPSYNVAVAGSLVMYDRFTKGV